MRRAIAGGFAALLVLFAVTGAWAHAALVGSDPPDGARLDRPPPAVELRFNEPVSPVSVRVLGPDGQTVALPGQPGLSDGALRIPLPAGLAAGTHVVSYRVVSADGHPVAGSVLFGIGAAPDPAATGRAAEAPPKAAPLAAVVVRALHYASLLATTGGGLFLALVLGGWSPLGRRLVPGLSLATGAAAVLAVLHVGLSGVVLEGAPLTALVTTGSVWTTGVSSTAGLSAAAALLGLIASALGLALFERGTAGTVLLLVGAAGGALALTATGHAATAEPRALSVPLVALHGLAAAFWVGAFWPLTVVLRRAPAGEAALVVRRFSSLALSAVAVLVLAGAGLSVLQLADPRAILNTAYGQLWLGKMLCALVLLALAGFNRLRLTPALGDGPYGAGPRAAARLRGSVHTEMVVAALILLFTAGLGTTPPPRAQAAGTPTAAAPDAASDAFPQETVPVERTGFSTVVTVRGRPAILIVTPARPGPNRVEIRVAQADGTPLGAREATAELALPAAGIEPITRPLSAAGPGVFAADGVDLPLPGAWAVRLDVLVGDFEKVPYRAQVRIGQ